MTAHTEVSDSITDDKFRDRFHMALKDDGTLKSLLCPYFVTTCGSQWLQPQSDKDVSKFLNANIGQFLHAIAAMRIGADTFS